MLIAGLTLGLGIFAVFAGIIYRLSTYGDKAPEIPAGGVVSETLPVGAKLVSSTAVGNRIVLTYEHAGGTTLILIDAKSLTPVGRLELKPQTP